MWIAASRKLGKRRAVPLVRLLLGTTFNVQWAEHVDDASISMWRGGSQGTAEMPPFWELYLDHALRPALKSWTKKHWGPWYQAPLLARGRKWMIASLPCTRLSWDAFCTIRVGRMTSY